MLIGSIPINVFASKTPENPEKIEAERLYGGTYSLKIPGVDYSRTHPLKLGASFFEINYPPINPTDDPDKFDNSEINVGIDDILMKALGVTYMNVQVEADGYLSEIYKIGPGGDYKFGETIKNVPIPKFEYFPALLVTIPEPDNRDLQLAVEAYAVPENTQNNGLMLTANFVGHSGVSTKWYGEKLRPQLTGTFKSFNNRVFTFSLPAEDEDIILRKSTEKYQWKGHPNVKYIPTIPDDDLTVSLDSAIRKFSVTIDGKSQGRAADSNYYFESAGDGYTGFYVTLREKVKVNFDANGGSWKTAALKEQYTAYGLKASETFMEGEDKLGPINIPEGATALTPPEVQGKANEFKGWNTDKDATDALDLSTFAINGDTTFYAIYSEEAEGKAEVLYVDDNGNDITIDDSNKIDGQEYPTSKIGTKDTEIPSDVFTADTAPKLLGYKFNRVVLNPTDGKYTTDGTNKIKIYYDKLDDIISDKTLETDTDKPEGYVTVSFDKGEHGTLTGDTKFYVNPRAGKTNTNLAEPTITANLGYTVGAVPESETEKQNWSPKFEKSDEIKEDKTYIAQYEEVQKTTADKIADIATLSPVDFGVFVGTDVNAENFWKQGIKATATKPEDQQALNDLLATATKYEDLSNRTTGNVVTEPIGGKIKVTFEDKSSITVENQKLYVWAKKTDNTDDNKDLPKPEGAIQVSFKVGEGVTGLAPSNKAMTVESGTSLESSDFPVAIIDVVNGYKGPATWSGQTLNNPSDWVVTKDNSIFTATAIPKDKIATEDPKDPNYVKVTFDANGGHFATDIAKTTKDVWVLKVANVKFSEAAEKAGQPSQTGKTFKEWQDKATGGQAVASEKVLNTADETFYAAYNDKDKIKDVDDLTKDPEAGYVRLIFDATEVGKIGTESNAPIKKAIDVLEGTLYTDQDLKDKGSYN